MKKIEKATIHMKDYKLELTDISLEDIKWMQSALDELKKHIMKGEEE